MKFQLCYDKSRTEKALTWSSSGFTHEAVDTGETGGHRHKEAAILVPDGVFESRRVLDAFERAAVHLPPKLVSFVVEKSRELPNKVRHEA